MRDGPDGAYLSRYFPYHTEEMNTLTNARVKIIQPGIESLATTTLKLMKKGTTAFRNLCLMKFCAIYDIEPAWNLLIGFPGEGEDVYSKYVDDIPLLTHLPPPTGVYPVRFDRYSPYFMKSEEYGLDLHPLDYYSLIYPFPEEALDNLAYYFGDSNSGAEYAQMVSKWIGRTKRRWIAGSTPGRITKLPQNSSFTEMAINT